MADNRNLVSITVAGKTIKVPRGDLTDGQWARVVKRALASSQDPAQVERSLQAAVNPNFENVVKPALDAAVNSVVDPVLAAVPALPALGRAAARTVNNVMTDERGAAEQLYDAVLPPPAPAADMPPPGAPVAASPVEPPAPAAVPPSVAPADGRTTLRNIQQLAKDAAPGAVDVGEAMRGEVPSAGGGPPPMPPVESQPPPGRPMYGSEVAVEEAGDIARQLIKTKLNTDQLQARAQAELAAEQTRLAAEEAARQRLAAARAADKRDKLAAAYGATVEKLAALQKESVDPNRLWAGTDTGSKIGAVITGALMGFGGSGDAWMTRLDNLVRRDVELQQAELLRRGQLVGAELTGRANMLEMHEKAGMAEEVAARASYVSGLELAQKKMEQSIAGLGDARAKEAALESLQKLQEWTVLQKQKFEKFLQDQQQLDAASNYKMLQLTARMSAGAGGGAGGGKPRKLEPKEVEALASGVAALQGLEGRKASMATTRSAGGLASLPAAAIAKVQAWLNVGEAAKLAKAEMPLVYDVARARGSGAVQQFDIDAFKDSVGLLGDPNAVATIGMTQEALVRLLKDRLDAYETTGADPQQVAEFRARLAPFMRSTSTLRRKGE